jgi:hypothetical protein
MASLLFSVIASRTRDTHEIISGSSIRSTTLPFTTLT